MLRRRVLAVRRARRGRRARRRHRPDPRRRGCGRAGGATLRRRLAAGGRRRHVRHAQRRCAGAHVDQGLHERLPPRRSCGHHARRARPGEPVDDGEAGACRCARAPRSSAPCAATSVSRSKDRPTARRRVATRSPVFASCGPASPVAPPDGTCRPPARCSHATPRCWRAARTQLTARRPRGVGGGRARPGPGGPAGAAARARRARRRQVGLTGLERIFDERLLGRPGGRLLAGTAVLGTRQPRQAPPVRTARWRSACSARPSRRSRAASAGWSRSTRAAARSSPSRASGSPGLQPPGSTFKIITLTGALEARLTGPGSRYPVQTEAVLEGVALERQRQVLRRLAAAVLRRVVQLGDAPLKRPPGRAPPGRRGRALRLQQPARHRRRGDEHDPQHRRHRRRARSRLVGHRAGTRPGHRAADGRHGRHEIALRGVAPSTRAGPPAGRATARRDAASPTPASPGPSSG